MSHVPLIHDLHQQDYIECVLVYECVCVFVLMYERA